MAIDNLREFARDKGILMPGQATIAEAAQEIVAERHGYTPEQVKENFDELLLEVHDEVYAKYLDCEQEYVRAVLRGFVNEEAACLVEPTPDAIAECVAGHHLTLDRFYMSLAQSRKSRAGSSFENIHKALFLLLGYPFDEQQVINGKPDFVMPSVDHFRKNKMECVIFTAKRIVRERWRQIVTEGGRGLGFYLATVDPDVSGNGLKEMLDNRIWLVCPESIRAAHYAGVENVLSYRLFFDEHLDPKMRVWKRLGLV